MFAEKILKRLLDFFTINQSNMQRPKNTLFIRQINRSQNKKTHNTNFQLAMFFNLLTTNKKILEIDYPRGRAVGESFRLNRLLPTKKYNKRRFKPPLKLFAHWF
ncbi:hypothetical protein MNBD_BACTEROID03-356 [hydrothermal vent metagenome]|uniref:Uncharacterized protein n=1 Tax=hydrothermal vent metagenome TaxID=652676 RepID=A0A3B0T1F9_9ZZZZ